jgi:hypothetical protein
LEEAVDLSSDRLLMMVHTRLLLSNHLRLSLVPRDNKASILAEKTGDSLLHVDVCRKSLASRYFLWVTDSWESLGPILPTELVTAYGITAGRTRATHSPDRTDFRTHLDYLKSTWLADAKVKQAVAFCLQIHDTDNYALMQA